MKDVISLTSKVSRRQGIDLSLQQQHPVKIFKAKKVVSSTTKSLGCWSMPRDEMWVWCQKKTPKQWDHIWLWSFKYRNGQPRKREQPKQTSKKNIHFHSVANSAFFCHSDFTWNQFWGMPFCNLRGSEFLIWVIFSL